MFILLTITLFLLKFLAVGVVGLFFMEDLELTRSANGVIYSIYFMLGVTTFFSLLFFALGKRLRWLIVFLVAGVFYLGMYNGAPGIKEIHKSNNLKSRYFKDTATFFSRMKDVVVTINEKIS
jgi:hypothetical protein